MATRTFIGGHSNNTPGDPANWTPYGAPAPGDTLLMKSGTMNIGGGGLAGDVLTLGEPLSNSSYIFNLSNGAVFASTTADTFNIAATVNVDGRATATFGQNNPGNVAYTVNLHAGSTLLGNYVLIFNGIEIAAAAGAVFENDGASLSGGSINIDANVAGTGSFSAAILIGRLAASASPCELGLDVGRWF